MIAAILAAALVASPVPSPVGSTGRATWYDATRNNAWYTQGGNRMYGAVGNWKWGDTPYDVVITNIQNGKRVRVVITDYCHACKQGRSLIDLSPQAFKKLGYPLSRGVMWVRIEYPEREDGREEILGGRTCAIRNYNYIGVCSQ